MRGPIDAQGEAQSLARLAAGARAYLLIALVAAIAAFAGLTRAPTFDRDEGRYAQSTTQMLETGDFIRIRYLDTERNKKPAGAHWLQAASVALVSDAQAREIWAYRLPSLLGAVIAALATFWAGIAVVGRPAAFLGAMLFAPSALIAAEGQIAKTDALLCAACAAALGALARLRLSPGARERRTAAVALWAAVGAGVLIKGPVAPLVVGGAVAALCLWERRIAWLRPMLWPLGPLLAAAIALPWWIAIGVVTEGRFYVDSLLGDAGSKVVGGGEHPWRPPGLHLLLLPLLIFPASLGLPAAGALAVRAARGARDDADLAGVRILVAWAAPTFLMFELAPTKLVHYTLPAFPAIALLVGAGLLQAGGRMRLAGAALFILAGAGLVALAAGLASFGPGGAVAWTWGVGLAALLAAAACLAGLRSLRAWLAAGVACGLLFAWGAREGLAPAASELLVSARTVNALDAAGLGAGSGGRLWLVGYAEPSLVFEGGPNAWPAEPDFAAAHAAVGDRVVVEGRHQAMLDAQLEARGLRFAPVGAPIRGAHYNNSGRSLTLQPGRVIAMTE